MSSSSTPPLFEPIPYSEETEDVQLPIVLVRPGKSPYILHFVDTPTMLSFQMNDASFSNAKTFAFLEHINSSGVRTMSSIPIRFFFKTQNVSKNHWIDMIILHEQKTIKQVVCEQKRKFINPLLLDSFIRDTIALSCQGTTVNHSTHSTEVTAFVQNQISYPSCIEFILQEDPPVLQWYRNAMEHWKEHKTLLYTDTQTTKRTTTAVSTSVEELVEEPLSTDHWKEEKEILPTLDLTSVVSSERQAFVSSTHCLATRSRKRLNRDASPLPSSNKWTKKEGHLSCPLDIVKNDVESSPFENTKTNLPSPSLVPVVLGSGQAQ